MPQNKSQSGYQPRGRFKLPTPRPMQTLSLFQEYPYVFLAALFVLVMLFGYAAGMRLWDAFILGAWIGSMAYFGWQLWRYWRYRANPEAVAKEEAARRAFLNAKARESRAQAPNKPATSPPPAAKPRIAAVPRKPAQRVPIRKPGMNVKVQAQQQPESEPQTQPDQTPKT